MAPLLGAEKANIALSDGRILRGARIVSVGENSVNIVHEVGIISISAELVPLEVLARAKMEFPQRVHTAQAAFALEEARTRNGVNESSASAVAEARAALALAKAQMEPHPQQTSSMASLSGAEKANIALRSGTVLKDAKIVIVGKTSVSIAHEDGVATVPREDVPVDVLARAHMKFLSPMGQPARLREPEKVTAVEMVGPPSLQAPRDPVSSETYIPEKASGSKIESESVIGGKTSSDVLRTQAKESGGTIQKAGGAAIDRPRTVILVLSSVLCCALVLAYHGSDTGPITDMRHLTRVVFRFGCTSLVLGLFAVYLWERPPAPASASERTDLHSQYLALKAEEDRLRSKIYAARAVRDSSAIPALAREVDDLTRRIDALTAAKLRADREGKE